MNKRRIVMAAGGVALVAAGLGAGYWFAMRQLMGETNALASAPAPEGKKPLYWHDPMYPQQKFDKPGKSPFMDMMLVPVYGDDAGDNSGVAISSRVQQNLGVRTVEAKKGALTKTVEAIGTVAFDERAVAVVQARTGGFIERLHVRAPLEAVTRGQPLADIVAPEWAAAQEEYLALLRSPAANDALRDAARQRLAVLGMPPATIEAVERDRRARSRITLTAPIAGVIAELGAREGMSVAPGAMLFRINGLATVWINAEVPEAQAAWVKPGAAISATVPAYPGENFKGQVAAILPEVNAASRTLKARIQIANPQERLKPGMYATVDLAPQAKREVTLVPTEAVIRTGSRNVVVIADTAADGKQRFQSVDVELGDEAGGMTEIRKGIAPGTKVVASGQFLIDSEASLKAAGPRLSDAPGAEVHRGEGRVEKVGPEAVTLSHGPIPSMKWGDMTMDFMLPAAGVPVGVKEGAMVTFEFRPNAKGQFELTTIAPKGAAK